MEASNTQENQFYKIVFMKLEFDHKILLFQIWRSCTGSHETIVA